MNNNDEYQIYLAKSEKARQARGCGKISSHAGWYRGRWSIDTCECGHKFHVPIGKKNHYRCNCCADMAEF